MAKQIDGQLSFDFMDTFNTKEISMDDYLNKPENADIIKKKTEKKKQDLKKKNTNDKSTAKDSPIKETKNSKGNTIGEQNALSSTKEIHSDKEDLKEIKPRRKNSPVTKPISDCVEHYQKAADYVKEHRGITIGTIMRLYRLSAVNAKEIFQRLWDNKVIDESGRICRTKKEL